MKVKHFAVSAMAAAALAAVAPAGNALATSSETLACDRNSLRLNYSNGTEVCLDDAFITEIRGGQRVSGVRTGDRRVGLQFNDGGTTQPPHIGRAYGGRVLLKIIPL